LSLIPAAYLILRPFPTYFRRNMIAFDVFLNRKKLVRAGVGTDGVLTAMTTWVRRRAPRTRGKRVTMGPV
jgi:hypothetical protein